MTGAPVPAPAPPRRHRRWRRFGLGLALGWLAVLGAERALEWAWPYPLAAAQALPLSTVVTAADGTWLRVQPTPRGERALPLRWQALPQSIQQAILHGEDERFFAHGGVDWLAIGRAAVDNLAAGRIVSGASTLTMQVVRLVEPRPRTFASKAVEVLRARQLERRLGKAAIADLWLQQVPMGGTLRGFEAAARHWFGRAAAELDLAQAAALVAMVPAPSARSPLRRPALLRARRNALLDRLRAAGVVDAATHAILCERPLGMARRPWPWLAPELVDLHLARPRAGAGAPLRTAADVGLDQRLRQLAREAAAPGFAVAIAVLGRGDGRVLALVGDRTAARGLDTSRQPRSLGSTLKPFLYALARESGALGSLARLDDQPRAIGDWRPANFHRGHAGSLWASDALAISNNLTAVQCLERVGVDRFRDLLRALGLPDAAAGPDLTAALGTGAASPLQLARAWQRFVDAPATVGLSPRSVRWVLDALERLPLVPGQRGGQLAWKSGTSSGRRDAWCVGVDAEAVLVVWLGHVEGHGHADLVGARTAAAVLARAAALR